MTLHIDPQIEQDARREVVRVCRLLWERGYVAATDGNVSVRLGPNTLLTTPSGMSKGFLTPEQLVLTDVDGTPLPGERQGGVGLRPSSELRMHCEAYRLRRDVRAVVHAHPPIATACTVAGVSLEEAVLPEVIVGLGGIPTARYARPGSEQGPEMIRGLIADHDALLLDHHGSLTVGKTPLEAYLKLEKVENAAQVYLAARQLGAIHPLPPEEVSHLMAIHQGLRGAAQRGEHGS